MKKDIDRSIKQICKATGWGKMKAGISLSKASKLGITPKQYLYYEGWIFSKSELKELKSLIDLKKEKKLKDKDWAIKVVCSKTRWDYEDAKRILEMAKNKGYSYRKFIMSGMCKKTEKEIKELQPYVKSISPQKQIEIEENKALVESYRNSIMKEMGWSLARLRLDYMRAHIICGCSNIEYYRFKIYKNGYDEGLKFITQECNSKMKVKWGDWGGNSNDYFQVKELFNREFKDFIHRRWFSNKELTFEAFEKNIEGLDRIIFKPISGMGGNGLEIFELDDSAQNHKEVYEKICSEDALIEEVVVQHREISEFYPHAVNTIRVMSLCDKGEVKILNAVMKFSTNNVADNLHFGGIVAGVDVETGKLCTNGISKMGEVCISHPYSGKEFKGFQIPNWDKLIETIKAAGNVHSEVPYIGWDVSIRDDDQIEIIEGNHRQDARLIQFPFACDLLEGKRHTIEPYLWFDN